MTAPPEPDGKKKEIDNLPPTLADEISKLDPVAIAKDSSTTEGEVRTRLTRLVQKVHDTERNIIVGKHKNEIDIIYDNGLLGANGLIDAQVIEVLERKHGSKEGYDILLERIYREVNGSIQGVRQAVPVEGRIISDQQKNEWKPVICYIKDFETSGMGYSQNRPGQLVKSLSFIKVPNNQPAKTP